MLSITMVGSDFRWLFRDLSRENEDGTNDCSNEIKFFFSGMNIGQFMNSWKEECDFWLNLKLQNDIQVEIFKVVGQREVR